MGPTGKTVCLVILGLYIPFQLVDTFYYTLGDNDQNERNPKEFFGPFTDAERPIRIDKENEQEDEANSSRENSLAEFFQSIFNKSKYLVKFDKYYIDCV